MDSSLRSPTDGTAIGSRMRWLLVSADLKTRRVTYQLFAPIIVHDRTRRRFPLFVRVVLRLIDANDFMQLSTSEPRGR
jgi:hypothetical protein